MKRILIVTTIQNTIEAFLIPHIKMLERNEYEVWIATNIQKEIPEELKNNRWINISFSRNPFSKNSFRAIKEMKELIKNNNFEVIHFHTPVASFLGRYAAMKKKQKNIIYTAHGFHFFKGAPLKNWLIYYSMEKLAINWTDKIITINEEDFQRAQKMARKNTKVYKIDGVGLSLENYRNGNFNKIKEELKISENEFVISMIGELNKNKNQIQLLKAVSLLKNKGINNIRIVLVGVGNQKNILEEEAKKNNLKIDFLGYRKDVKDIIAASHIICSMSYREGLPRNIMEGMAQGKSFIVTNIRGNQDIIKSNKNGLLVEVDDFKETAYKIESLIKDRNMISKMAENNFIDVNKFSIEKILKEMEKIYE
ncbi:glycosyltransferase family 4 protein (plasmid) [Cetobacterium somerae]|uniref:glycosyltransferase family 4 protein n=1 Tax=Cetobacterium somerae TaxID=188913 RepID=UPI002E7B71AA|nr:glycosyltransferase family 4 protein [Cetobacterium somerae]WVJ02315.1 glycosyltransferase family 4 protein [Cetobacterium somerae]